MSEKKLDRFRREVDYHLACGVLADLDLPVTDDDGGFPVVVALEDEQLSTLLGRLRAVGGYANLFVRCAGGRVQTLSVVDDSCSIGDPGADMTPAGERPGVGATVGMFLAYVALQPNGVTLPLLSTAERPSCARDARTVEFA